MRKLPNLASRRTPTSGGVSLGVVAHRSVAGSAELGRYASSVAGHPLRSTGSIGTLCLVGEIEWRSTPLVDGQRGGVNKRKLLQRLLASPNNARFDDVRGLVEAFGFRIVRTSGSHHIFSHPAVPELLNLQEVSGEAKPYQIRQFLRMVERHNLPLSDAE
jgi:hypothetical protein